MLEQLRIQITALLQQIVITGPLKIGDAWAAVLNFLTQISELVGTIDITNPDKKQLVMEAAGKLFDLLWPKIVLPGLLGWLKVLLTPTIKNLYLLLIDHMIEYIYQNVVKPKLALNPGK